jgi:predicted ester cyclase
MATVAAPSETASNAELIRWAFDILNTHDIAPLKPYWTQATRERFPTETCVGPDAIGAYFEAAFAAVPDFDIEIIGLAEQGADVFVQWRITGTHSGAAWRGIAPTRRAIELDGIDHFVVREGKIESNFVVFDQLQFARQIGMMPLDGSAADRGMKAAFNAKTRLLRRIMR